MYIIEDENGRVLRDNTYIPVFTSENECINYINSIGYSASTTFVKCIPGLLITKQELLEYKPNCTFDANLYCDWYTSIPNRFYVVLEAWAGQQYKHGEYIGLYATHIVFACKETAKKSCLKLNETYSNLNYNVYKCECFGVHIDNNGSYRAKDIKLIKTEDTIRLYAGLELECVGYEDVKLIAHQIKEAKFMFFPTHSCNRWNNEEFNLLETKENLEEKLNVKIKGYDYV